MNPISEQLLLKGDAKKWAAWENQNNAVYWRDRLQNGSGLIRDIAKFVVHATGEEQHDKK